ncbi:MAG: MFS transporter [Meiothermus sp.]|uniref:MFS transporter n=1 Tax=Meiothermus sp. TaxID=1955249 RepID=UPI0025F2C2B4|nr:MFS transporter [Meiothermus sp.]MCS7058583.1 MFS transporter [Meiothermus sp.]MCS7193764.1 MFS transporter [Meiothermus sp.]MCX7739647.1 MFS transporter [Meiothermus sp.]MDW8091644.1 MFS transporter [Meiothermus sp.]MDW8481959.1 MFS transporter [Meiothermus sp.]
MRPHTTPWYLVLSSYWFASSFKWFLILLVLLPARVAELVPEVERATRLGFLFALGAAMALIGPPLWGYVSDRVGRRMPFLAIGAVLTAAALVWMAYAPSYFQLVLAYLLLQVADDMATGPYSALIPDLAARRERGVASGWLGTLQVSGQVAAGVTGFLLAQLQLQFLLVALLNLLTAALTLRYIGEVSLRPQRRGLLQSLMAPWRSADFRWVWLTRFLVMLAQYGVQTYLQYYLADVVQSFNAFGRVLATEAFQAVALLGLLISVGAALAAVPAGRISDRKGRKPLIYLAGAGLAVLMLPLWLLPRFDLLLVLSLFFGLLYGAYLAVDWALVADVLPSPEAHATDMGLWQTSIVLPQVLAGAFGGVLDGLNRQSEGLGYTVLFLLAAVCFVLGTLLVRQIRSVR